MFAPLAARNGAWGGFTVVHLGRDTLAPPGVQDAWEQRDDVLGALTGFVRVEDDVVVVKVQHHRDVQLLAERQDVVNRVADVVVLEDEAVFDVLR